MAKVPDDFLQVLNSRSQDIFRKIVERYLDRDKVIGLFPPQAALMRDPADLTPLDDLIAQIEMWQPRSLATVSS